MEKSVLSYFHGAGSSPLLGLTIGKLLERAVEKWGDVDAIVDVTQRKRKTFRQVLEEADRLAAGLMAMGILEKGDRVALLGPNSYEWYLSFVAIARAGYIAVLVNPVFQAPELEYCFNKVDVKVAIIAEKFRNTVFYDLVQQVEPKVPTLKTVIMMSGQHYPRTHTLSQVMNKSDHQSIRKIQEMQDDIQIHDVNNIQFTSGTTGQPKATQLAHHGIVNNAHTMCEIMQYRPGKDRLCVPLQLFHSFGNVGCLLVGLAGGVTIVLPSPGINTKCTLEAIESEKCTVILSTPTMYVDMMEHLTKHPYDVSSLELAVMGGSLCPTEIKLRIKEKLAPEVISGFGMTETGIVVLLPRRTDSDHVKMTTLGGAAPHVEVKIVEPKTGKIVPTGVPGELCVRGYLTMKGYWGDPEKTAEMIDGDHWLHTGDIGILDRNGNGNIVGRIKEMIIRGGENIFPKEIEDHLLSHPDIADVQVVGVPDARLGEEVCAWVRPKPGRAVSLSDEKIRKFCKGKIAYYKIPRYIFIREGEDFPRTASGKVQKIKLQEESIRRINISLSKL